jgi:enamine deaminase RidA (YjgF/YER057c/UK114 family)
MGPSATANRNAQMQAAAMDVEERLAAMGLVLPAPPAPVGNYRAGLIRGTFGSLSGQLPIRDGKPAVTGVLGLDLTVEQSQAAARLAGLNVLAQLKHLLGTFDRLAGLIRMDGVVASVPEFDRHPAVLDGASDLFAAVLGERGVHTRSAIGATSLPLRMPVELVVTFATRP